MDSLMTGYDEGCQAVFKARSYGSSASTLSSRDGSQSGTDVRSPGSFAILHPDLWANYEADLNLSRSPTTTEERGEQFVMDNPPTGNGVRFPMSLPESSLALANIATLTRKAPNGMSPGEHRAMYFDPESSFWASIEVVTHNAVRKPTVEEITRWTQQGVLREVFPYLNVRCDLMPQIHEILTKTRMPTGTSNRVMSAGIKAFDPTIQRIAAGALYVHLADHRCKVLRTLVELVPKAKRTQYAISSPEIDDLWTAPAAAGREERRVRKLTRDTLKILENGSSQSATSEDEGNRSGRSDPSDLSPLRADRSPTPSSQCPHEAWAHKTMVHRLDQAEKQLSRLAEEHERLKRRTQRLEKDNEQLRRHLLTQTVPHQAAQRRLLTEQNAQRSCRSPQAAEEHGGQRRASPSAGLERQEEEPNAPSARPLHSRQLFVRMRDIPLGRNGEEASRRLQTLLNVRLAPTTAPSLFRAGTTGAFVLTFLEAHEMECAYDELTRALKMQRSSRRDLRGLKIQHRRPPRVWPSRRQKRPRSDSDDEEARLSPPAQRRQAAPRTPPRQTKRPNTKAPKEPGHYGPVTAPSAPKGSQKAKRTRPASPPATSAARSASPPPRAPTPGKRKAKKARNGSDPSEPASRPAQPKAPRDSQKQAQRARPASPPASTAALPASPPPRAPTPGKRQAKTARNGSEPSGQASRPPQPKAAGKPKDTQAPGMQAAARRTSGLVAQFATPQRKKAPTPGNTTRPASDAPPAPQTTPKGGAGKGKRQA